MSRPPALRIVSLVPGATDALFALGVGERVVGVSQECALPAGVGRPRLARSAVDPTRLSSAEIDRAIRDHLSRHEPLFRLDRLQLQGLRPDLIITQQVCQVCAVGASDVERVVAQLPRRPAVLSLHTHRLQDALDDIVRIGQAASVARAADALVLELRRRLARVTERLAGVAPRPRVFCLEWIEPLMATGHWVPDQVAWAGGAEVLGQPGDRSRAVTWPMVREAAPEVVVVMPCGLPMAQIRAELPQLQAQPEWQTLPAVATDRVALVEGSGRFSSAGPRLVDGVEFLARLFHPDRFPEPETADAAVERRSPARCQRSS